MSESVQEAHKVQGCLQTFEHRETQEGHQATLGPCSELALIQRLTSSGGGGGGGVLHLQPDPRCTDEAAWARAGGLETAKDGVVAK